MFTPVDPRGHAIREAVFSLALSAPVNPGQVKALVDFGRANWKVHLPRIEEIQFSPPIPFPLPAGVPANFSLNFGSGVQFQSFKIDGSLAWRLLVQENTIAVNCLDYDGWASVWPRVQGYLEQACGIVLTDKRRIASATLQYINGFVWDGVEPINFEALLKQNSTRVPENFLQHQSKEWHLHQGWFESREQPVQGRILSREHLSSQWEGPQLSVVIDLTSRYDFGAQFSPAAFFPELSNTIFQDMRRSVRTALRTYVVDPVLEQIGAEALQ
jgi:uncharacterized protein (TIGR04255 family)